jgi:hypothetical protein
MVWAASLSTTELSPRSLTPRIISTAFAVWLSSATSRPLAHPELYLRKLPPEAARKCISGRTSYFRVRLAFHLHYPQLILEFRLIHKFEPPLNFT